MLDLQPRTSEGGRPVCRCAMFEEAMAAADNLRGGPHLTEEAEEPLGEHPTNDALVATIRSLQRRIMRLECAAEGHPRAG